MRPLNFLVREVHFLNVSPGGDKWEHQVAASLVGLCFSENKQAELDERIRYGFQHLGFFKARTLEVTVEAPDSANPPTVSVIARVEAGEQYRLKGITFVGNKAVANPTVMRNLFPLRDYEIFDRERVGKGLENLRDVYSELGYINFSAVPATQIDEENKLVALSIDLDEGTQFSIKRFTVEDADGQRNAALRALWPGMLEPGRIYNARLIKLFFVQARQLLPPGASPEKNLVIRQNSQESTVDIVLKTESDAN